MLQTASNFISSSEEFLSYKLLDPFRKLLAGPQIQGAVLREQKATGSLGQVSEMLQDVMFDLRQRNGSG